MIEITTKIKKDEMEIGELEMNITEDEFTSFVEWLVDFREAEVKKGSIRIVDSNGNYNNNFTIPEHDY